MYTFMAGQPTPPGHVPLPEIRPYDQGVLTVGFLNKAGYETRMNLGGVRGPGGVGWPAMIHILGVAKSLVHSG